VAPRRVVVAVWASADQSLPYVELPSQESRIFLLVHLRGRVFKRWVTQGPAVFDVTLVARFSGRVRRNRPRLLLQLPMLVDEARIAVAVPSPEGEGNHEIVVV
jgi:hypothetical protein